MKTIQLTEIEYQNLLTFLTRVTLNGAEVPAFNDIIQRLRNPIENQNENKTMKE